ncbi:lipopolysaccharide biosynthesis protein [Actinomycetospora atypica]|uniref:Lipopolysaccharide biosynthesis protein n=1 Tax=Actinomycetospora atypica TaxID=1290095 RepID=A0ABV9YIT4_9PSEU
MRLRSRLPVDVLRGWRAPQHRDGAALVLSSALSSVVGLGYWVLAARLFPPAVVGVNTTIVSTLTMLAGIAQLNLGSALLRFVPEAGRGAGHLVAACYALGVLVGTVTGLGFALGAAWWAPELVAALGERPLLVLFVLATPVWTVFVMQDYVLTATKRATVVPLENLAFAVGKVFLLLAASTLGTVATIAGSWTVATAITVVVVSLYLRRVLSHGATTDAAGRVAGPVLARYVVADWTGTIFLSAVYFGLPLLVLARLGPDAAATFGVVWTVAFALYLVAQSMGQSLVAHTAAVPERAERAARDMAVKSLTVVGPAALVLAIGASPILRVFGEHYVRTGTVLLALTALSAVPNIVGAAGIALARVHHRRLLQVGVPLLTALLVIPSAWASMPAFGLAGVGMAALVGQSTVAGCLLVGRWFTRAARLRSVSQGWPGKGRNGH